MQLANPFLLCHPVLSGRIAHRVLAELASAANAELCRHLKPIRKPCETAALPHHSRGHVPRSWTSPATGDASTTPAYSRAHNWLLLAGHLGRYALQGLLPAAIESSLFQNMESIQKLTAREFSMAVIQEPQTQVAAVLTKIEQDFPAWELYVTRQWSFTSQNN